MTIRFLSTVLIFLATMIAICSASSERKEKELSVIFYLDSQQAMPNEFSMKILQDMAEVGSSEYMDIILQIGCTEPLKESNLDEDDKHLVGPVTMPHWKGVRRYVISQEKKADLVETLPEDTMMNSSENLEHFITWAMEHYNSKHYAVVLMEHGHAWKGFRTMNASEIGDAIKKGVEEGNKITGDNDKIDLFYLQSCLMGSIESVTALKDSSAVLITSENPVYALSNRDFDFIFGELLKKDEVFDPYKFAFSIVENYKNKNKDNGQKIEVFKKDEKFTKLFSLKFESRSWFKEMRRIFKEEDKETCEKLVELLNISYSHGYPTLSAIDTTKLPVLIDSLRNFVNISETYGITNKQLFSSIEKSVDYGNGNTHHYSEQLHDMGNIMKNIINTEGVHEKIKESAGLVVKSLEDSVINEEHDPVRMKGSTGLSIWGPVNALDIAMTGELYREKTADFTEKIGWYFLMERGIKNLPQELQQELSDLSGLIKETNSLLEKLDKNRSLPKEEKLEMARKIVANKKVIYKSEADMILSKYLD